MAKTAALILTFAAALLVLLAAPGQGQAPTGSSQEDLIRAVYAQVTYSEVQAADSNKLFVDPSQRLEVVKVQESGEWAVVEGRLVWADGSGPVPTSGVLFLARRTPWGWQPVHRGHPDYASLLEALPAELVKANKDLLR